MKRLTVLGVVFSLVTILGALFVPSGFVDAAIVPECPREGAGCSFCHLASLTNNLLLFIVELAVITSALMFAIVGVIMMANSGKQELVTKAKSIFGKVFIGLIIVLSAWLLVDTILKVLTGNKNDLGKPWQTFNCSPVSSGSSDTFSSDNDQDFATNRGAEVFVKDQITGDNDKDFNDNSGGIRVPGSEQITDPAISPKFCSKCDGELNTKLEALNSNFPSEENGWSLSNVPLQTGQLNRCFEAGSCVHIELESKTDDDISNFFVNLTANDLRSSYIVSSFERRNVLKIDLGFQGDVVVVPSVSVEHFQVFRN